MRLAAPDRKKQLLDIAMKLFSEQGFDGTSTRQIADAAGINEAIIFRHFKTKEDLYWAVLADRIERRGRNRRIKQLLESKGDSREVLAAIAQEMLDRTADDTAVTRLLFFSALRNRDLSERFFETYAHEKFELLAEFIRRRRGEGKFREVDPMVAARSFLGMIIYHYLVKEVFGGKGCRDLSSRELAEQVTDIFIGGISARHEKSNGARTLYKREAIAVGK